MRRLVKSAALAALLLLAHPSQAQAPDVSPGQTHAEATLPEQTASATAPETVGDEDREVMENLELLEELEAVENLELLLEVSRED